MMGLIAKILIAISFWLAPCEHRWVRQMDTTAVYRILPEWTEECARCGAIRRFETREVPRD